MVALILFVFGCVIGSFLSVVIIRSIREEQWVEGRSHCDSCGKPLAWYDNVPLFSFLVLRGQCRHCRAPISLLHPVVEMLTGMLFVWWYFGGFIFFKLTQQPFSVLQPMFWLLVGVLLLILFFTDLLYFLLPDTVVFLLFLLTATYRIALTIAGIMQFSDLVATLLTAVAAATLFFALWYATKGKGMGFGDVKLVVPLALLMGWPIAVVGLWLSFMLGAVVGLVMVALGKKRMKQAVPFGPFLIAGTVLCLVWGDHLLQWYLRLL